MKRKIACNVNHHHKSSLGLGRKVQFGLKKEKKEKVKKESTDNLNNKKSVQII